MRKRLAERRKKRSFRNQIHLILLTLGIAPYGLAIYVFSQASLSITQTVMLIAVVALLFHLLGFYMLRRFSDQLILLVNRTARSMRPKQSESASGEVPDYSVVELNTLTKHFQMLLSELEEHKRQQSEVTISLMKYARDDIATYQKQLADSKALHPFVHAGVLEQIRLQGAKGTLGTQKRLVTVLFADIRGFTTLSEQLTPGEVVQMLNDYFEAMVRVIHAHHGVVDKFIGDSIMGVFGLTQPKERSTVDAIRAAISMREAAMELTERRKGQGLPVFSIGIGLNTGEAVVGSIGSEDRKDYTVIGDTVNVASRLQDLAKSNQVVASDDTLNRCKEYFSTHTLGSIQLKNRKTPVCCHLVLEALVPPPAIDFPAIRS